MGGSIVETRFDFPLLIAITLFFTFAQWGFL
jgi:hypothetical protein